MSALSPMANSSSSRLLLVYAELTGFYHLPPHRAPSLPQPKPFLFPKSLQTIS